MTRQTRTSMMTALALLLMLGAVAMASACGDDDGDSGSATVDSGLPEDKKISDLDEQEVEALCDAAESATEDLIGPEFQCVAVALFFGVFSEDAEACQTTFDLCSADPEQFLEDSGFEPDPEEGDDECNIDDIPEDCDATVGEIEACLNEQVAFLQGLTRNFQCAELLADFDGESNPLEPNGPACQVLEQKCPGFIEDDDDANNAFPNNDDGAEFGISGSGLDCGGDTMGLEAFVTGEATSVEVELYIGDNVEVHPLTLDSTNNGEQTWNVRLNTTGTFEAGVSTSFNCDQFDDLERVIRVSGPEGDLCEDTGGERTCP